jgi:hypothetical protein
MTALIMLGAMVAAGAAAAPAKKPNIVFFLTGTLRPCTPEEAEHRVLPHRPAPPLHP